MGETDRIYATRHPIKWAGYFWPHIFLFVVLVIDSIAIAAPVYSDVIGHRFWPLSLVLVGLMALTSAFFAFHKLMQAITGASIAFVSAFRILAYIEASVITNRIPDTFDPIAISFAVHWFVLLAIGAVWPRISAISETRATTRAGREICP